MNVLLLLLILMVLAGLWSILTSLLLRATIALALTSVLLTVVMFQMNAPLAAVFELSVCAGLISVVFISVISLTHRQPLKEYLARRQKRILRFWPLPVLLLVVGVGLSFVHRPVHIMLPHPTAFGDIRIMMWQLRRLDLFGQILVLLAGVYGVLILFRGNKNGN